MCPVEQTQKDALVTKIDILMQNKESLEMQIPCSFIVAEQVCNDLIEKGYKTKLYEEFKELCIAVWKTKS